SCSTILTAVICTRTARRNTHGGMHDSSRGAPAHRGGTSQEGRVVGAAAHRRPRARQLHRLLDVGGAAERALLRRAVSLALLFPVHLDVVPALHVRLRAAGLHVPDRRRALARLPDPVGSRTVPADLLLLPQGVLPLVLARAGRVRGARREERLLGG